MTQVGEGQQADEVSPVMAFGAPTVGEILAERYELAEHINDDSAGRQVWRGVDVILRRPVAVVLRYPGGDSAMEMLLAAVTASRVIHPNLVGVYDAIDEGERAYVVREWVDGTSLRETVAGGVLDSVRATTVAHAVTAAVAAVHATGMVHGNVHPGTVLIANDGRVVLADARADGGDTSQSDIRAVGGILYFALTGHWPHAETALSGGSQPRGRSTLPDAMRDTSGTIAAPRQARAGVPAYLDDLTMDLLDPRLAPPTADVLAAELGRHDTTTEDRYLDDVGPLRFAATEDAASAPLPGTRRKVVLGVAGLLVIALAGLALGIATLGSDDADGGPTRSPTTAAATPAAGDTVVQPQKITLVGDQVRVVDPEGDRTELKGVAAVVDGDPNSGWSTDSYRGNAKFGGLKKGMGILITLPEPRAVSDVQVLLSAPGASVELLTGTGDPGSSKAGDTSLVESYTTRIGEPYETYDATKMTFSAFGPDQEYQYLLVWISELPASGNGQYQVGVQEITVQAR